MGTEILIHAGLVPECVGYLPVGEPMSTRLPCRQAWRNVGWTLELRVALET